MITYFKVVYRRHTNFAQESIEQTFNGAADFGTTVTSLLSRTGDLIHSVYLQATLPDLRYSASGEPVDLEILRWTDDVGHHLIREVSVDIGGQLIDRQYGDWLEIWAQLTVPAGKTLGYREMIGQDPRTPMGLNTGLQADLACNNTTAAIPGRTIYVPLQFWFCRNVGLALPLIALQFHDVRITLKLRTLAELTVAVSTLDPTGLNGLDNTRLPSGNLTGVSLWVDYIYLDTDERRRFAQVSHEYLIEQVQYNGEDTVTASSATLDLAYNHPVKELIWVCQYSAALGLTHQYSNYTTISPIIAHVWSNALPQIDGLAGVTTDRPTDSVQGSNSTNIRAFGNQSFTRPPGGQNIVATAQLRLNGHDRFDTRDGTYFNKVQTYEHHTNIPASPGINVYSFALKPELHQPSGTCNFSRIDTARLVLTFNPGQQAQGVQFESVAVDFSHGDMKVRVYAVNYNILRIMGGMGGVAYN